MPAAFCMGRSAMVNAPPMPTKDVPLLPERIPNVLFAGYLCQPLQASNLDNENSYVEQHW